ncbi:DNA (cytosine-5-)-methyltransferase [Bacillus wiedmannii]|nr:MULTISPECIES: DNA (cytosine-5-)-methyltransferase [Bacillus cereus group]EEK69097.1 Modification methylase Sau3AI [Bacillus wiedmannii]MBJ7937705.1 DNA (cytosine-5-)-methyltransferase [Bacillus cereus]MCC2378986.1 DNA (cytosine-5-)-methyltransferase [Bacillus wiedmannii]MCC2422817.1 DNA (cytosine-5-)-methyltransferase [Bacillus wiedmannii]
MVKVVELFAGVGGFRLGLEANENFEVLWGNQWEPSTKAQHAFNCYATRFENKGIHVNRDIAEAWPEIPEHDLLVGGFPCQDYSVARTLSNEKGIQGKKGVLFWEIMNIVNSRKPRFVLLENVDRLLKSPAKQRGRDFSIMLASFRDAGYVVEWRVINAADYGYSQRRRRVFIFAYLDESGFANIQSKVEPLEVLCENGFFAPVFKVLEAPKENKKRGQFRLPNDIVEVSDTFKAEYYNSGVMIKGQVYTEEVVPVTENPKTLGEIVKKVYDNFGPADESYYLKMDKINKKGRTEFEELKYLKGPKKEERVSKATGHKYFYSEGGMAFPDDLDKPGRTMLTSEGTCNRSSHVIEDPYTKRLRYLTPVECELLNGFPMNWTNTGMPQRNRYFCMGNALVVDLVKRMGERIVEIMTQEEEMESSVQLSLGLKG